MKTIQAVLAKVFVLISVAAVLLLAGGQTASAQYVPVYDSQVDTTIQSFNTDFNQYVTDLFQRWDDTFGANPPDGTTDSLRDLIAGSNPKAPGNDQGCLYGDNLLKNWDNQPDPIAAFAYGVGNANQATWGPWKYAFESSTVNGGTLPEGIQGANSNAGPYTQINYSHSLRCLLEEQVEWQKLGLSIQIHAILKNYITDAQNAQLTKQLKNRVTAANITFSKGGNVVNNNGVVSNSPVFVTSYNQNVYNVNERQLDAITDQAAADPASGNPAGSLGLCQPWRIDVAADTALNNRTKVEDPYKFTNKFTKCSLADPTDPNRPFAAEGAFTNFSDNFNDPASRFSGIDSFNHLLQNPADSPLGAQTSVDMAIAGRIAKQEESTRAEAQNSGFIPTKSCSGDPADPYCLDDQFSTSINPGGQNQGNITNLTEQMNNEIAAEVADAQSASTSMVTPSDINTNTGLAGANTLGLETSGTAVNVLIQELYDTIQFGYFGTNGATREWAQGTMLMIYDEMKFNQSLVNGGSASVVTNGTAPEDTGY